MCINGIVGFVRISVFLFVSVRFVHISSLSLFELCQIRAVSHHPGSNGSWFHNLSGIYDNQQHWCRWQWKHYLCTCFGALNIPSNNLLHQTYRWWLSEMKRINKSFAIWKQWTQCARQHISMITVWKTKRRKFAWTSPFFILIQF